MHKRLIENGKVGTLYGVGVGPGDPELLTLKAVRLIQTSPVVAYLANAQGDSMARSIAERHIGEHCREHPIVMAMCKDRRVAEAAYDQGAEVIATELTAGNDLVFLCEGDPFFFGSFAYLHDRLSDRFPVQIVPGVSSINACSALSGHTLARLSESVAIVSGRNDDAHILSALAAFDNVAIMKAGRHRGRLVGLIEAAGRVAHTCYIEHAGTAAERVVSDVHELGATDGPYFSMFLIRAADHSVSGEDQRVSA